MGVFPASAQIVPNPYNKIPGFWCTGPGGARVYFVPGFPVMAHPMIEWALDTHCHPWHRHSAWLEKSVVVFGSMEASLTPLMEQIESQHPVKVFSLPSVDHPQHGRHIELGVKGEPSAVEQAYSALMHGLQAFQVTLGPELVR
jgi:molybdopterin-biosynthesis enzyme MoeA-like protein